MAYQHERATGTPAPESRYTYERRDSSAGAWIAGGIAIALVAGLAFYFASGDNTAVDTAPGAVQTAPAPAPAVPDVAPMAPAPTAPTDGAAPMAPAPAPTDAAPAEPAPAAPEATPAPAPAAPPAAAP